MEQSPESKARQFFGEHAAHYRTSAAHSDAENLARIVELCAPAPHMLVLDIATGAGHTACTIAPQVRLVAATDFTPAMLRETAVLAEARGVTNVARHACDVHALPYAAESFDLVLCRRAAHHFTNLAGALAECRRVLKPGGRLIIDDRSVPEDDALDVLQNQLDAWHDPSHVRQYRPSEWKEWITSAGFRVIFMESYDRLRPLSAFLTGASPAHQDAIRERIASLSATERAGLGCWQGENGIQTRHWYVIITGAK